MDNNNNLQGTMMSSTAQGMTERRRSTDRRTRVFRTMLGCVINCRRDHPQRLSDRQQPYYYDFFESRLFVLIVGIVILSVTDAAMTLRILAHGGNEINPVMDAILAHGPLAFFSVKYGLTCIGLLICLLHIRHRLFKLIPMYSVLFALFCGYLALVAYEVSILMRI